jgi:hypothetical protein
MELNKFLNKTDIQLYKGILDKIFREFDTIEPQVLGDLLDKLRELHQNLDTIVKQKQTKSMYDDDFFQYTGEKREKDSLFNECVKSNGVLLKDIYTQIKNKRKQSISVSK